MRLLFVHGAEKVKQLNNKDYYTDGSYSETVWERYLKECTKMSVIFRKDETEYTKENLRNKFNKIPKRINVTTLADKRANLRSYFSLRIALENKRKISEEVKKCDFAIIRVPSSESYEAIKICEAYNKPYIVEVVGCSFDSLFNMGLKGKMIAPIEFLKQRKYIKKSKYTIYVTKNFLQNRYPTKGEWISCSDVEITIINRKEYVQKVNQAKKRGGSFTIATIGSPDNKSKGQEYVIKAIAKIKDKDIKYYIIGEGDSRKLREIAKKNKVAQKVYFLGSIPHNKIITILDNIDLYIQPSLQEGLCRSLLEAMSRGCPCIASDAGGNSELIDAVGIFRKRKDYELYKTILKFMNQNISEWQSMRNINKSKLYEKPKLEEVRNKFIEKFKRNEGLYEK